jgi:ribulose-5-phosphate 4-epimerase/fuculose-1-phosphate aldolase
MNETQAREEICRVGRSLFERGLVHATAGNISVRLDGSGFLITPTDACLGFLDPAQLALVNADGVQTSGERASKTLALHQRIYQEACRFDPATRCVIHTHSTHCVALTLRSSDRPSDHAAPQGELLPALTPYYVMKVGHVPVIPYHRPGSPEAATLAAKTIARYGERNTPIRALMLARLGPNVWHESPAAAMAVLDELEETARLYWMQRDATPEPIDDAAIRELRSSFGARW